MNDLNNFPPLICAILPSSDEPPKVTDQPKSLSKVSPGKPAMFTLQATGTEPLSYHWQWKPVEEEGGSEGWQTCRAEWSDGATLTIPSVQKSNEGNYRCVIRNCAGSQTSNPAELSVGKINVDSLNDTFVLHPHVHRGFLSTCS